MATVHPTELRAEIPSLEPDGVLLDQLAALALSSALNGPPARTAPWTGWRVALAATAAASVIGGGAWVAAAMTGEGAHTPAPVGPVTHPGVPEPSEHQVKDPDRASGRSSGASGAQPSAEPHQQQSADSGDDSGDQPQAPPTTPAGTGPVTHPTSDPTDEPGDQGQDDPSTGSGNSTDDGTDAPGDDSSSDEPTQGDGGDSGTDQTGQGDSADHGGE